MLLSVLKHQATFPLFLYPTDCSHITTHSVKVILLFIGPNRKKKTQATIAISIYLEVLIFVEKCISGRLSIFI